MGVRFGARNVDAELMLKSRVFTMHMILHAHRTV